MKNLNHLSDSEFIEYMDRYSDDPHIKRLVSIRRDQYSHLVKNLVEYCGMDEYDFTFDNGQDASEYIQSLQSDLNSANDLYSDMRKDFENLEVKYAERTVVNLISSMQEKIDNKDRELSRSFDRMKTLEASEKTALSKLKIWTALSTDVT